MKLRIRGNSLRLRLTQSEVRQFAETGCVEESIRFGPGVDQRLTYQLLRADCPKPEASFAHRSIIVKVPDALARSWTQSQLVGMEHRIDIGDDGYLSVLVEKDFECLQVRVGEEDTDTFPNPKTK